VNCVYELFSGPPGQIAYVYVEAGTITAISARLGWTLGARYGGPILYYTIEWSSEPYTNWTVLIQSKHISLYFLYIVFFSCNYNSKNIIIVPWRSVLIMEATRVPGENHRPAISH